MYGGLTCDYPGCGLPITARCNLCGRSFCVRHVQWIGTQGAEGSYISGHYRCDLCSQQVAQKNAKPDQRAAAVGRVGLVLLGFGTLTMFVHLPGPLGNTIGGWGFLGCFFGLVLTLGAAAMFASRYR